MPTLLRPPRKRCCAMPDIKNEGKVKVKDGWSWSYYCYRCHRAWEELARKRDCGDRYKREGKSSTNGARSQAA